MTSNNTAIIGNNIIGLTLGTLHIVPSACQV